MICLVQSAPLPTSQDNCTIDPVRRSNPALNLSIHTAMTTPLPNLDPKSTQFKAELSRSEASSIVEREYHGTLYALKVVSIRSTTLISQTPIDLTSQFHNNDSLGFTKRGRDINLFRNEVNAYQSLHALGVCDSGLIPKYYASIHRLDPSPRVIDPGYTVS